HLDLDTGLVGEVVDGVLQDLRLRLALFPLGPVGDGAVPAIALAAAAAGQRQRCDRQGREDEPGPAPPRCCRHHRHSSFLAGPVPGTVAGSCGHVLEAWRPFTIESLLKVLANIPSTAAFGKSRRSEEHAARMSARRREPAL